MKKKGKKEILNGVWGEIHPGEITAIMGLSGAGKTSLLQVLSGRCQTNKKVKVESDIRLNQFKVDPTDIEVRKQIAFVTQDDALSFTSTPREAIRFSAKLRLPRITTDCENEELTNKMISELGLEECADTMIGGELVKGISGGERKRTSIGCELVTKPALVFLDGKWSERFLHICFLYLFLLSRCLRAYIWPRFCLSIASDKRVEKDSKGWVLCPVYYSPTIFRSL
jgi:ABC-type multidrug transport system ATPase subunit